jgi:hypothetical protein
MPTNPSDQELLPYSDDATNTDESFTQANFTGSGSGSSDNDDMPHMHVIPFLTHQHPELRFDGTNITQFLREYNRHTNQAQWDDTTKSANFVDWCNLGQKPLVDRLSSYGTKDWADFQSILRSHYATQDRDQYASNRAYLESYVHRCAEQPIELVNYYTEFTSIAQSCIENGRLHDDEQGWYFFKGLSRDDREKVMYQMPENERPEGTETASYHLEKMYSFLRKMRRQREGVDQCNPINEFMSAQRANQAYQHSKTMVKDSIEDTLKAIAGQDTNQSLRALDQNGEPDDTDPEIKDLVKRMKNVSINLTMAQFIQMAQIPAYQELWRKPANMTYALSKLMIQEPPFQSRNDGSYQSEQAPRVDFHANTRTQNGGEYDNRCIMCMEGSHRVRDCPAWRPLRQNGWAFSKTEEEGNRRVWKYYFGGFFDNLGEMPGQAPRTYIIDWIKHNCRSFFNVLEHHFSQRAKDVRPEKFNQQQQPVQVLNRSEAASNVNNKINTLTIADDNDDQLTAEAEYNQFASTIKEEDSSNVPVWVLDDVDQKDLILCNQITSVNAATRSQDKPRAPPMPQQEKRARVHKPPTNKQSPSVAQTRLRGASEFDIHPDLRNRTPVVTPIPAQAPAPTQDSEMPDARVTENNDSQTPTPTPATIGWDVRPSDINSPDPVVTVPRTSHRKRAPQPQDQDRIQELLGEEPSKAVAQTLGVEVRGLNVVDLFDIPDVRKGFKNCIQNYEDREREKDQTTNLLQHLPLSGQTNHIIQSGLLRRNINECNAIQTNRSIQANSLVRHQITGMGDTWRVDDQRMTNQEMELHNEVAGMTLIALDLPECWGTFNGHKGKCLIDTGSMMNVMRESAARALNLIIEEFDSEGQGVISANGGVDPYVGTAWDVPISIGLVTTHTNFRIVRGLTRSIILGVPWCASSRLALQFSVSGRCDARILSDNGRHNATFTAVEPSMEDTEAHLPHPGND